MTLPEVSRLWRSGEAKRLDACLIAATLPDPSGLAVALRVSDRTAGRILGAGKTYKWLVTRDEELAQRCHKELTYLHFALISECERKPGNWALDALANACDGSLSIDQFAATLPRKPGEEDEFMRTLKRYAKRIPRDFINVPMFNWGAKDHKARDAARILLDAIHERLEA